MGEKLSDEKVKRLLAPWRFSLRAPGFEDRITWALHLFEHFPLDITVTGGTPEANAELASLICDLEEDNEEFEWETEDEDDESEETEEDEEPESEEEHDEKINPSHQSSRRKHVRISEENEYIGSGSADFYSVFLHNQIPNVRVSTVQGHPTANSIIKQSKRKNDYTSYDVLVILTNKEHNEDHMWFKMEMLEQVQSLFLVEAEQYWDVVEEKPTGPCMTCAWERMKARKLELEKRQKEKFGETVEGQSTLNVSGGSELVKMKDIARVLAEAIPCLRQKAFSQFMVASTQQAWVPKLLTNDTQSVIAKISRKISNEYLDQISKFSLARDLTDNPAKLQAILDAHENFWLDVGVLGYTGCGSSSFVNALIGQENTNKQVASVGVTETTTKAAKYPYPNSLNVHLWDLPGLGSIGDLCTLPSTSSSAEALHVASLLAVCDVYILLSPLRLTLGSLQLLQQASSLGKECHLVLSMADLIEERSVVEVKLWTEEVLAKLGLKQKLFLISSHHPEAFDMPKLKETLHKTFPSNRKVALARYISKQLDEDVFWKRSDSCRLM